MGPHAVESTLALPLKSGSTTERTRVHCTASAFPSQNALTPWTARGSPAAAASAAIAASAVRVSAAIAASVAGAAAPPGAFGCHSLSVYPDSGAPGPAAAGVCLVPVAAA